MKVTERIKEQHRDVEELFERFEDSPAIDIVQQIYDTLYPHHYAEEKTVFPKVSDVSEQKKELVHALKAEHRLIHLQLQDILLTKEDHELFEAKVSVLKEVVDHHITEEEEVFFKHAEEVLSESQLNAATEAFDQAEAEYENPESMVQTT